MIEDERMLLEQDKLPCSSNLSPLKPFSSFIRGERAQLAIYDAILFFILLSIASAILYMSAISYVSHNAENTRLRYDLQTVNDIHDSVLLSIISETGYLDSGERQASVNWTVLKNIEFYLEHRYVDPGGAKYDLSEMAADIAAKYELALLPGTHYALYSEYKTVSLFLSDSASVSSTADIPINRVTAIRDGFVFGERGEIYLYMWRD